MQHNTITITRKAVEDMRTAYVTRYEFPCMDLTNQQIADLMATYGDTDRVLWYMNDLRHWPYASAFAAERAQEGKRITAQIVDAA